MLSAQLKRISWFVAGLSVWGAALYGCLQINQIPGNWEHSICGPWGCGPPPQALVAWHSFSGVFLAGPAILIGLRLSTPQIWRCGALLAVLGAAATIGFVAWDLSHWLPNASSSQQAYALQHGLFAVAILVDVPLVSVTAIGLAYMSTGWWRRRRELAEDYRAVVMAAKEAASAGS